MTIIETTSPPRIGRVTVAGAVHSRVALVRLLPDRRARVSFRIDGEDGPHNVHVSAEQAEVLHAVLRVGDRVRVGAPHATLRHPAQTIPDLEADTVELLS